MSTPSRKVCPSQLTVRGTTVILSAAASSGGMAAVESVMIATLVILCLVSIIKEHGISLKVSHIR